MINYLNSTNHLNKSWTDLSSNILLSNAKRIFLLSDENPEICRILAKTTVLITHLRVKNIFVHMLYVGHMHRHVATTQTH